MGVDDLHAMDPGRAAEKIDLLLRMYVNACSLDLTFEVGVVPMMGRTGVLATFSGPDTRLLLARNAELLHALEGLATEVLRLSPEDHELISFDAENYKAARAQRMRRAAEIAVSSVRSSGRPYAFPPMNSRERRMLHLELARSGLRTASSGEASRRFVVVYPADTGGSQEDGSGEPGSGASREKIIRSAFRPR